MELNEPIECEFDQSEGPRSVFVGFDLQELLPSACSAVAQDPEVAQVESSCDPGPPDENSQRNGADSMATEQAELAPKVCPSGMDQQWEEG
jgi:hypothetical protein